MKNSSVIEIKTALGVKFINVVDIVFIKTLNRHSLITIKSKTYYEAFHPIGWFEMQLPAENFYRCHRSYIVNYQYVDCLNITSRKIFLVNGYDTLPLSRCIKHDFKSKIKEYASKN